MILYKYYSSTAGLIALESSKVGFRTPIYFNDPFEASVICGKAFTSDRVSNTLKSVAILSLTRTPLNALMWAHYGEEHKGIVIGYEVDDPFFQCKKTNLIPVQKGNVIYTKTKPFLRTSTKVTTELCNAIEGLINEKDYDLITDLTNHLFLNKDTIWSYEEEVRIVKSIINVTMETSELWENPYYRYSTVNERIEPGFSREKILGLKIYDYPVKIKEIFLGARNSFLEANNTDAINLIKKINAENIKVYSVSVDNKSWNLVKKLEKF